MHHWNLCWKWDVRKMNEEWRQAAIATGNAKWMSGINVVKARYPQVCCGTLKL